MKSRQHDPLRLDVAALAAEGAELSGEWPGRALERLGESQTPPQDQPLPAVLWHAHGERREVPAGEAEVWLSLDVQTRVWLTCQRCLQPLEWPLALQPRLRFVRGETQAEALDAEIEEDVLVLPRWLDLRELVEDELLLALPLVPRHGVCPQPLPRVDEPAEPSDAPSERPNPFELLRRLKTDASE